MGKAPDRRVNAVLALLVLICYALGVLEFWLFFTHGYSLSNLVIGIFITLVGGYDLAALRQTSPPKSK